MSNPTLDQIFDTLATVSYNNRNKGDASLSFVTPEYIDEIYPQKKLGDFARRIVLIYDRGELGTSIEIYRTKRPGGDVRTNEVFRDFVAKQIEDKTSGSLTQIVVSQTQALLTAAAVAVLGIGPEDSLDIKTHRQMMWHAAEAFYGNFSDLCLVLRLPGYDSGMDDYWDYRLSRVYASYPA